MNRVIAVLFLAIFILSSCSFSLSSPSPNNTTVYELNSHETALASSDALLSGESYGEYYVETKKENIFDTKVVLPILPTDELNNLLKASAEDFLIKLDYPFKPQVIDFFFDDIYPVRTFTFYVSDNPKIFKESRFHFSYNTSTKSVCAVEDFLDRKTIEQLFGKNASLQISKVDYDGIYVLFENDEVFVSSDNFSKEKFINVFHPDIYTPVVDGEVKYVALTFDDGPNPLTTPKLLDILEERDVQATFFMVGYNVDEYRSLVKKVYNKGHDIGIHSFKHSNYLTMTGEEIIVDLDKCADLLYSIIGRYPYLVRPPFGNLDTKKIVGDDYFFVNWNVDPLDWKSNSAEEIANNALSSITSGSIILLHDIYESSCDAAAMIIDRLIEEGYRFVTISEYFDLNGKKTDNKLHFFRGDFNG